MLSRISRDEKDLGFWAAEDAFVGLGGTSPQHILADDSQ